MGAYNFIHDAEWQDHLRETFPPDSPEGYLGKEGFQATGYHAGLTSYISTSLFDRLVYPIKDGEPLDPNAIGLVVVTRKEAGIPLPPPRDKSFENLGRNRKRYHPESIPTKDAAVQASGIILLRNKPDLPEIIDGFSGRFAQHLDAFICTLDAILKNPDL